MTTTLLSAQHLIWLRYWYAVLYSHWEFSCTNTCPGYEHAYV